MITNPPPHFPYKNSSHCEHISAVFLFRSFTTCWCSNIPSLTAQTDLVSRGQPLFRTEGKGLGFGHRATCRPAPWSAYQSQHSIQSHDAWSMCMWLTEKFKISVWIESEPEVWEVRTEREVSCDVSWNTAESKSRVQKGRKSYFAIVCTIAMWRHGWIYMTN